MANYEIVFENATIALSCGHDGYWLYDETRGMNLAMRAKTEQAAFVEALEYYQKRLTEQEDQYKRLRDQVDSFVEQFVESED